MGDETARPLFVSKTLNKLCESFNGSELQDLCLILGLDSEQVLTGDDKRSKARSLIGYMQRRGLIDTLLLACEEERPNVCWSEEPDTNEFIARFRDILTQESIYAVAEQIKDGKFDKGLIEDFIANSGLAPNLRLMALAAYVQSGLRNMNLFNQLLLDFEQDIRVAVLNYALEKNIELGETALRQVLNAPDSSQDVMVSSTKMACELVKRGTLDPSVLACDRIANHSYWLIRHLAIKGIIEADPPDGANLLSQFSKTKYHLARANISDYFVKLSQQGRLTAKDVEPAVQLLEGFIRDDASPQSTWQFRTAINKIACKSDYACPLEQYEQDLLRIVRELPLDRIAEILNYAQYIHLRTPEFIKESEPGNT
jgi:hypothetical protein